MWCDCQTHLVKAAQELLENLLLHPDLKMFSLVLVWGEIRGLVVDKGHFI